MRIGIDARFYGPSAGTGIGRYTNRLIEELERFDTVNQYVVFLRRDNFDYYHPTNERFTKVLAPWRWYSIGEQLGFPRLLRRYRLDLTHYLNFNVPLLTPRPFVVTIHDLILSKFPTERASTLEPAFYWLKHAAYNAVIRTAVRRSSQIIAVTEHTRKDIDQSFSIPKQKATVIYEGSTAADQLLNADASMQLPAGVRRPFILYVGRAYPHKNLERLCEAAAALPQQGAGCQLVLAGSEDYFYRRLKQFVAERGFNANRQVISFAGYVDDSTLNYLYKSAAAYVCPSLYEGFGLPGLEAMAHGTPVVSSNVSSLPEVYGQAAEYFNPERVGEMVTAIQRVVADPNRQAALRSQGYKRIKRFSWSEMAKQTLAVYNAVARQSHA